VASRVAAHFEGVNDPPQPDPPRRRGGRVLDVHGPASPWTILPDVELGYWTIARGWEIAPTLWPPRRSNGGRERERDWYVYAHLEVQGAATVRGRPGAIDAAKAERVIADYRRAHTRSPWIFLPLRFAIGVDTNRTRVPRGYLANFLALIGEPGRFAPDILDRSIEWQFRVKVHTATTDYEQDEKPSQLRFTRAVKILEAHRPEAHG